MSAIIFNKAKCLICRQVIRSTHRHEFKTCKCGSLSVDGGTDYLRRVGGPFEELSETEPEPNDEVMKSADRAIGQYRPLWERLAKR